MNTIYFINSSGGVKIRPTSRQNEIMWEEWYQKRGLRKCTKDEYDALEQELKKKEGKVEKDPLQSNILLGNAPITTWSDTCIECHQMLPAHAPGCSLAPLPGDTICPSCGGVKVRGTQCFGDDECNEGPDGGKAECCQGWGRYCCRCGASYARDQM